MASSKKGGLNKAQAKKTASSLRTELNKCNNAIKQIEKAMDELQTGKDGIAYWSGEKAYNWIKSALDHIANDKELLIHVQNCVNALDKVNLTASSL